MGKEPLDISNDKAFDNALQYPDWCQSEAARFVWKQSEQLSRCQIDRYVEDSIVDIVIGVMQNVTNDELDMFASNQDVDHRIQLCAQYVSIGIEKEKEAPQKNEPIDELIKQFCNEKYYPAIGIRHELQERFSAQSHQDQIRIIRTFLESDDDVSRRWCYEKMQKWWDDCLIPDIKKAWESYQEYGCAAVVAERLPLEYVVKHKSALERVNYAAVCHRLATFEDYECGDSELTRKEFLSIAAHKQWPIDDKDADELLFGFILAVMDNQSENQTDYPEFDQTIFISPNRYTPTKKFLDPIEYTEPSLLHIEDMSFYIDSMAKLGRINTLKKLYRWDVQLKHRLAEYLSALGNHEEIVSKLLVSNAAYKKLIWERFMDEAANTFPFGELPKGKEEFKKTHNKYHFKKQEQKEYYPGGDFEERRLYSKS